MEGLNAKRINVERGPKNKEGLKRGDPTEYLHPKAGGGADFRRISKHKGETKKRIPIQVLEEPGGEPGVIRTTFQVAPLGGGGGPRKGKGKDGLGDRCHG